MPERTDGLSGVSRASMREMYALPILNECGERVAFTRGLRPCSYRSLFSFDSRVSSLRYITHNRGRRLTSLVQRDSGTRAQRKAILAPVMCVLRNVRAPPASCYTDSEPILHVIKDETVLASLL